MYLTRHQTPEGSRLACDGVYLPRGLSLDTILQLPRATVTEFLELLLTSEQAVDSLLPPLESMHEVWACGVTYLRSREARESESETKDVYEKVYMADRPEVFFKSIGWRVAGHKMPIRIRRDSRWNVPEPELTLVINRHREIVGFCCGNDVSSRDIEGENPLYLPQAKIYNGSCAIGPGIEIVAVSQMRDIVIGLEILRSEKIVFQGETRASRMKRSFEELVGYLTKEIDFPDGVFLMTGTGVVPADDFSLQQCDVVRVYIGSQMLENQVAS
jgi:2-dehydro-3-deoxy-D-arabinonate dehydratase